jgi:hypothetical protein
VTLGSLADAQASLAAGIGTLKDGLDAGEPSE